MKHLILFFGLILLIGCKKSAPIILQQSDYNRVLNTVFTVEPNGSELWLDDYFTEGIDADRFMVTGFKREVDAQNRILRLTPNDSSPNFSMLTFAEDRDTFVIPIRKSSKQLVRYEYDPLGKSYRNVHMVGDINAWNPANTPMTLKNGKWVADLYVVPGTYGYQLELDGERALDANNPDSLDNGMGGWNSKLVVTGHDPGLFPTIATLDFSDRFITIKSTGGIDQIIALWQNQSLPVTTIADSTYRIHLPKIKSASPRSHIRIWGYNEFGVSNDLLIPLDNGKVVSQPNQLNRHDKAINNIYFVFVDRFYNGNKSNDRPLNHPEVHPRADVHGGDIQGVIDKLKTGYFDSLGFTAIWLSPIVKNPDGMFGFYNKKGIKSKFSSFHGYWPTSFSEIDERFGSEAGLKELIEIAHAKNMNVYLDFVANHVHELHPVYQANKDKGWATNLYLPDGTLNTELWDEQRLTTWFDVFLPTLSLEKQEVTEMLSDSALYWLRTYEIDGFRHDATKHIPKNFWRTLTKKVRQFEREQNRSFFQIGETYGTPELINSYINTGMLDAQFDFNVYDVLLSSICREDVGFDEVERRLTESFEYYGVHNLMGYMTGNQDKARFMAMATGDVRFDEDHKYAGWSRMIEKKTDDGYQKLAMMHAYLQTIPGVPVVYYGDEIGLTGGNDPDNRRDMRFDSLSLNELKLRRMVSDLVHLRKNNLAFLYGDFTFLHVEPNVMVYSRQFFHNFGLVAFNNSKDIKELTIDLPEGVQPNQLHSLNQTNINISGSSVTLTLPPHTFDILTKNNNQ